MSEDTAAILDYVFSVRTSTLFQEFTDAEIEAIAPSLKLVSLEKGGKLFEQDAPGDSLYILLSGQVAVQRKVRERNRENDRMFAIIGPGECVGDMALVDGGARSASIVALEESSALRLAREGYDSIREGNPSIAIKLSLGLCRLLSKRIRQIDKCLETAQLWLFSS